MTLALAVRDLVRSLRPALPVPEVRSLADQVAGSIAERRLRATPAAGFAALALAVAMVGPFGTLARASSSGARSWPSARPSARRRAGRGSRPRSPEDAGRRGGLRTRRRGRTAGLDPGRRGRSPGGGNSSGSSCEAPLPLPDWAWRWDCRRWSRPAAVSPPCSTASVPNDPATLAAVAAVVVLTALAASTIPGAPGRPARPMVVLRTD